MHSHCSSEPSDCHADCRDVNFQEIVSLSENSEHRQVLNKKALLTTSGTTTVDTRLTYATANTENADDPAHALHPGSCSKLIMKKLGRRIRAQVLQPVKWLTANSYAGAGTPNTKP